METNFQRKELKVSAIENGTVIDHIPAKSVFQVIRILGLDHLDQQVLFGTNLESKKYGRKGIIKVANTFFKDEEINKIALAAPTATLIVIRDFQIVEKRQVEIPDRVENIVRCINPNCITNHENVRTRFELLRQDEGIKLICHYCEKIISKEDIVFT